jgi:hypothetical protein
MHLIATGGASLSAQRVKCDCGKERVLAQITEFNPADGTTYLSNNLEDPSTPFQCRGLRPWLGTEEGTACSRPLVGSLRSASNLYFAQLRSAIYVPRHNNKASSQLVALLEKPPISTMIKALSDAGVDLKPGHLRPKYSKGLEQYTDAELYEAIAIISSKDQTDADGSLTVESDDPQTAFRRMEFNTIRHPQNEEDLVIKRADIKKYDTEISRYFSSLYLVEKLRETRALAGFTRIYPDNGQGPDELKSLLWRNQPEDNSSWLPAYVVHGEGIFMELEEGRLRSWEKRDDVKDRIGPLIKNYHLVQVKRQLHIRSISPRFVLLHTFAHLVMNRLTFECGYSSAALRERLFVSTDSKYPMAGILIYTAAGDAEGTMGGLVRMGKPGYFEPVIRRALEGAQWCSADPVCMEIGSHGQGPDSCNLAACHNCALVPETACEEFNRFLDRGLVVGIGDSKERGYFGGS